MLLGLGFTVGIAPCAWPNPLIQRGRQITNLAQYVL